MATKILDLYAELTLDNSSYMEGVEKSEQAGASFEKKIKNNAKNTQGSFENLSGALSICKTALASFGVGFSVKKIVDGLSQAYEEANKLDVKLRGASTLYGNVAVNQSQLADNLRKISLQTGESLETLGQTVYDAMSAGVQPTEDMANVLKVVSTSSKLAKAGFTDTNTAMKASLSVINAYGMGIEEVSRVSDILLQTQNLGVTTVGELGNALSKVTPTASAFGVSIENVMASLALMTKQGTNTEVASTGLSSILSELGKNGTTASENLAKASESAGLTETSFTGLISAGYSLGDILQLMSDYAERNNLSLVDMFSSIEAGKSALQLTNGGAKAFNETLESMESATGLVADGFEKMLTPSEKLDSAFSVLKETIGEKLKPAIDSGKEALAGMITKMLGQEEKTEDLDTALKTLISSLDNYSLAQEKAKEKTDATSLAMELFAQDSARASLRALTESWKTTEEESKKTGESIRQTETSIENLYNTAKKYAVEQLKIVSEEELDDISDYTNRVEYLLLSLQKYAKNRPVYSKNPDDIDYQKNTIEEIIDEYDKLSITYNSLIEKQKEYNNTFDSTATVIAQFVKDGKLSLSEIELYSNELYDEVVEQLNNIPDKIEEVNKSVEENKNRTVDEITAIRLEVSKAWDEYWQNHTNLNGNIDGTFQNIKEGFSDVEGEIQDIYNMLSNSPVPVTLKPFIVDTSPIALATTEFSNASKSILNDTDLTKVEIYTALKDLSKEYDLTLTDMEILSRAKADANKEIWKDFATGFKNDMQSSFYSVTQSFEELGEALVNGDDMWESFSSVALKALKQILESLGNQLTTMAITKALMGDWVGAGLATTGAIFAYSMAGVTNAKAQKLLKKTGAGEVGTIESETAGSTTTTAKTEEERKQEQIAGLEEEANMLQSIIDNIETGAEIPEQYQQDVKIRELNDRIRELESKITSLQDRKDVTINQIIDTVPMTPYELEQQAYIMAERLQWS